jgi:hypothetical protein
MNTSYICPKCSCAVAATRRLDGPCDSDLASTQFRVSCPTCYSIIRVQGEPSSHPFADNGPWVDLDGDVVKDFSTTLGRPSNLQWILRTPEVFQRILGTLNKNELKFSSPGYFWLQRVEEDHFKDSQKFVGWGTPDVIEVHPLLHEAWSNKAQIFLKNQSGNICIHENEISGLPMQLGLIKEGTPVRMVRTEGQRICVTMPLSPDTLIDSSKKELCIGLDLLI